MSFSLRGLGTAVPDAGLTAEEGLAVARCFSGPKVRGSDFLPAVYAGTGNQTRRQVLGRAVIDDVLHGTRESGSPFLPDGTPDFAGPTTAVRLALYAADAPPLAVRAARAALLDGDTPAATVTHLITVSCTGFAAPGVDHALITGLGLRPTVERVNVGFMGCHGAVNGLRVANAFAAADPAARVLVCAVELCSLHYHYGDDPGKVVANALFADGAAAVVGGAGTPGWRLRATGSCLLPESAELMSWTVGDRGFEMTLARAVPGRIARHVRPWLADWLGGLGLSLDAVNSWAVHPGGPRILSAVEEGLHLPPDALAPSRAVFAEYGNMSSPTVLFVLDRLRRQDAPRPCVVLGFGPGLTAEAAVWV